jgi:PAS domain S-box-containing protein
MIQVLYVDDESGLLDIGKIHLERTGNFRVDTAESGPAALEMIQLKSYDAIISDYQMPEMDGIAFLKEIRSTFGDIPFILFTGRGREEVVIEALNSGADFYLQKGGDLQSQFVELAHKIRQAVHRRKAEDALRNNEERLRESENRFRAIFSCQQNGIIIIDPSDHRIVDVNPYMSNLIGLPEDQIIGKVCHTFVCPAEQGRCPITDLSQCVDNAERVLLTVDGRRVPVIKTVARITLGEKEYLTENIQDITERKRAEESLHESRRLMESIIDFLPDATFVVNNDREVIAWNRAMEKMTGIPKEEMIGQGDHAYTIPFYGDRREQLLDLIDCSDEDLEAKYTNIKRDGNTLNAETFSPALFGGMGAHIWVAGAPLFDEAGNRMGAIESIRDITERKCAKDALLKANRQLNLLSSITRHDINNKIMVILGYLNIAKTESNDPAMVEYIRQLESVTNAVQAQIEFTRVYQDLGSHESQWQALDLILPRSHMPDTVTLHADVPGVEVYAEPMLETVFFNLLDNSIRHGQHVTEIRVSSSRSGEGLTIVWEDDGAGIPDADKERIFERGFGKNTGLGLFLVREILSLTSISIQETGTPGKGAMFEMMVPEGGYRNGPGTGNPMTKKKIVLPDSRDQRSWVDGRPLKQL